jgi:hypothetical protein
VNGIPSHFQLNNVISQKINDKETMIMKKRNILSATVIGSFVFINSIYASPASTDYVNQRIAETSATLNSVIQQAVTTLITDMNELRIPSHKIGERYQGGLVFFVDDTGLHGLIAAMRDANAGAGIQWQNGESGEKTTNARASGVGAGANNTKLIIAQQTIDYQGGNFAALAASNYSVSADGETPCTTKADSITCYGDWYLPSVYELDLMRNNLQMVGGFAFKPYWTSTEVTVTEAWAEDISTGSQSVIDKANTDALVRAIRAF